MHELPGAVHHLRMPRSGIPAGLPNMTVLQSTSYASDVRHLQALRSGYLRQDACLGVVVEKDCVRGYFQDDSSVTGKELFAMGMERVLITDDLRKVLEA